MKQHQKEVYQMQKLIPSRSRMIPGYAKAIYCDSDPIFDRIVALYRDIGGTEYPYCKLEFLSFFREKCKDSAWVKSNIKRLIPNFFALVLDRELLFAQTRERTSSSTITNYREYMTNMCAAIPPTREDIINHAIDELDIYFKEHIAADDTKLSEQDFYSMLNVVRSDLCPKTTGRPRQLIAYPPNLVERLSTRDSRVDADLWESKCKQELYDAMEVFGNPASQYYRENIAELDIDETLWKEMAVVWLTRLEDNIRAEKSRYNKYQPYFLQKQYDEFKQFGTYVNRYSNTLVETMKYINSIAPDDRPRSNNSSPTEKLRSFERLLNHKSLNYKGSPDIVGIFFLICTRLHPIFGKRRVNYSELLPEREDLISIEAGLHFCDMIEENAKNCLPYAARDLLAINNISITADTFEEELPILGSCMEAALDEKSILTSQALKEYATLFFSPIYCPTLVRKLLQKCADKLDWSKIPLEESINRHPLFGSLEDRIPTWRNCLIEYILMQKLVAQGHQDLQKITENLFRAIATT